MVNIGLIQMQAGPLQVQKNLRLAGRLIDRVTQQGAQLVVLPEMFNVGFYFGGDLMELAETLEGETVNWLKYEAEKHGVFITTSLYESYQGHFYNTMVMVGRDGSLQYYRKRNPTWQERAVWRRSDDPGPGIFDTSFGRIGGVICFDSFARETFEGLQKSEVDLVIIVACFGTTEPARLRPDVAMARPVHNRWSYLASEIVPHRYAAELKVPVVFVNQGGVTHTPAPFPKFWPLPPITKIRYDFCGRSCVLDAKGRELYRAKETESDLHAVVPVRVVPGSGVVSDSSRVDVSLGYLNRRYYFVQPPFLAKVFQAVFYHGLKGNYETNRKGYNRQIKVSPKE
jgi:predicted amidohydrolase